MPKLEKYNLYFTYFITKSESFCCIMSIMLIWF